MWIWPMKSTTKNNIDQDYLGKLSATIKMVAEKENAVEILEHLNVVPVLTAHPTQVQRKSMLDLTKPYPHPLA